MKYYVYSLLDPRNNNEPLYIGKGCGDRAQHHLTYWKKIQCNPTINQIRKEGLEPAIIIEWFSCEQEAHCYEEIMIENFGKREVDGGILTNLLVGGGRPPKRRGPMSEETKEKISKANKGKKRSKEICEKLSKQRKGRKRISPSQETRQKIREGNLGTKRRPRTEEENRQHSERMKAYWRRKKQKDILD